MVKLFLRFLLHALVLLAITNFVPGFHVASFTTAMIVVLVLAIINMLIKPVLVLLTLPITLVTLGLFIFVINIFLFWLTAEIVKGFTVDSLSALIFGWLLYSIFGILIHAVFRDEPRKVFET